MTLIDSILKKVKSLEYPSLPPETKDAPKKKKPVSRYVHVRAQVDILAPRLEHHQLKYNLEAWARRHRQIYAENLALLYAIRRTHFGRGKVDCYWNAKPSLCRTYYENRANFYKQICNENKDIYKRITNTRPRVASAAELRRDWARNRADIVLRAQKPFVLFPPEPRETSEDPTFETPCGVSRPRVHITLRFKDGAGLGSLQLELFTDVCPITCGLFLELLDGDHRSGYGYVGTCFFRKVPGLLWSGGDVARDNGFGCYAQRGRLTPIGAENYHFAHSMPGLLSMRVTRDNEVCGIFNITFKPLAQLDLRNVVFGRVIRPSRTYDYIRCLGSPQSTQPVVQLSGSRRRRTDGRWVSGQPNSRLGWLSRI